MLSEWDLRLGQQYQQALRLRKGPDSQALVASQRSWIQQRNSVCGGVAGTAVWSCVLDMTKQRIAALSEAPPARIDPTPMASPSPFPQPKVQSVPPAVAPPVAQRDPDLSTAPKPTAASQPSHGINPLLVGIFIMGAVIGAIVVFNSIRRREEEKRRAAERQRLVAKYGDEIADRILAHTIWQGMTEEQLLESCGGPADKDREIRKAVTKETWKYQSDRTKYRFSNRVFLENGIVIGWKAVAQTHLGDRFIVFVCLKIFSIGNFTGARSCVRALSVAGMNCLSSSKPLRTACSSFRRSMAISCSILSMSRWSTPVTALNVNLASSDCRHAYRAPHKLWAEARYVLDGRG